MPDMDVGMTVGLIKALGSPDPAVIEGAVSDWLDDHPEATTTVEDGAISYAKLDSSLQGTVDDVGDLKTQVSDLDENVYGDAIAIATSGYIKLNVTTADITSPTASTSYKNTYVSCVAGDKFVISGKSYGGDARLYAFVASDGTVLEVSSNGYTADNLIITAPTNTAYLAINYYLEDNTVVCRKGNCLNLSVLEDGIAIGNLQEDAISLSHNVEAKTFLFLKDFESGYKIKTSDGTAVENANYYATLDFIFIRAGWTIGYNMDGAAGTALVAFYSLPDESAFVSAVDANGTGQSHMVTGTFTAPSDGYVRLSCYAIRQDPSTRSGAYFTFPNLVPDAIQKSIDEARENGALDAIDLLSGFKKISPTIAGGFKVSDGKIVSQSSATGYYRTDYIPYSGESFNLVGVRCGYTYGAVAYYNASKTYISGIAHVTEDMTISKSDVPQNTAYVLFATNDNTGYVNAIISVTGLSDNLANTITRIDDMKRVRTRMKFGAHNGAEYYAPECTVPAYRIAGQQGWEWAWIAGIDFSTDGTMYVIHDNTVDRTTDGTGELSEMSDAEINALNINQTGPGYDLSDFDSSELKIPTFEQVLQQCVRYDMKMVIRLHEFPNTYQTEEAKAVWDDFVDLLNSYGVKAEDVSCYLDTGTKATICRTLIGDDVEISTFQGQDATAQDLIDFFTEHSITGNRAAIINKNQVDLAAVKLLHSNGIRVYVYGTTSATDASNFATMGVDIFQNGKLYKLTE